MTEESKVGGDDLSFESVPLTRPEYISAMVHFYRGEMNRSQIWRTRLDTTTNWAVVTVAGMISFAFSSPGTSAFALILANILVTIFLIIEARRYRYFSVYRARVRMIEENFYLPLIRRKLTSPKDDWRDLVSHDLETPTFKTTYLEALLFRIRRNYGWLYGIVLMAWLVKLIIHPLPAQHMGDVFVRMGVGPFPSWFVLTLVLVFYGCVILPLFTEYSKRAAVDEIRGLEHELDHWTV